MRRTPSNRPSPRAFLSGHRVRASSLVLTVACLGAISIGVPSALAQEPASAQATAEPSLADGLAALQNGHAAEAVEMLRHVAASEPQPGIALYHLGRALDAAEQREEAVEVFLKASTLLPEPPVAPPAASFVSAWLGAARAQARLGRSEAALRLLDEIRRDRRMDLTNLDNDPGFASLVDHPRFRALQPSPELMADPFVEPVRVLWRQEAESAGDNFGWIARRYGDVNGDGIDEVVTSAPQKAIDGAGAGKVYAYSGKDGALLWSRDGEGGWFLGRGVERAGDVNADGVPDVVASAPGGDRVFVFDGKSGSTLLEIKASQPGEALGQHVRGIGDVNGDGHGDVLVGAPQFDPQDASGEELADAGRAAIYSGADGDLLWQETGDRAGARLGETVTGGFDGRYRVWAVGAPGVAEVVLVRASVPEASTGASEGASETVVRALQVEGRQVLRGEVSAAFYGGMFMSLVGDVDADGIKDLYVSDWQDGAVGPAAGKIYVYGGADGRRLLTMSGEASGDGFGIGSAEAGDVDGDGHDDLVVGAWRHGSAAPGAGKVYVISGRSGRVLRTITSKVDGETFGFDAQGLGDVDGDGRQDLLITSAWSRVSGARSGRIFVLAGE